MFLMERDEKAGFPTIGDRIGLSFLVCITISKKKKKNCNK